MSSVRELQPGLWHWQSPHPGWSADEPWPQFVSSHAIDQGDDLLLFDPLAVPADLVRLSAGRRTAIVLTAPWHERDTRSLLEPLHSDLYTPPPDTEDDLMRKFGVTREQAAGGSPDLAWLMAGEPAKPRLYGAGDRLPIGLEAFKGREHNDLVLWHAGRRALVVGDTLVDFGAGLDINPWLRAGVSRDEVAARLRVLRELPVEWVLPAHGPPADRAALERALSK